MIVKDGKHKNICLSFYNIFCTKSIVECYAQITVTPVSECAKDKQFHRGVPLILGLLLITHFERSGNAGQFRTLVNQLVSFNLDQVCKSMPSKINCIK